MQPIPPKVLIKRHPALPLVHFLTRHIPSIPIALIFQIAQMARRLEILRRGQDPVEEVVRVEEENRGFGECGAEVGGEFGETCVPRGDGLG